MAYRGFVKSETGALVYQPPAKTPGQRVYLKHDLHRAKDGESDRGKPLRFFVDLRSSDHSKFSLLGLNPHENPLADTYGVQKLPSDYSPVDTKNIAYNKENTVRQAQALGSIPRGSGNSQRLHNQLHHQDPYNIIREQHETSSHESMDDGATQRGTPGKKEAVPGSKQQEAKQGLRLMMEEIHGNVYQACR
jgi:hypothetical protein